MWWHAGFWPVSPGSYRNKPPTEITISGPTPAVSPVVEGSAGELGGDMTIDQGGTAMATKSYIIALEEHYFDPEVKRHITGLDMTHAPRIVQRLDDVGELRLREMDEAGIDVQVLSHANPGLQKLDAETAVRLARGANDRLHEAVQAHPDRFAAFAAIPTPEPKAAADELERAVTKLGFKGALVNGLTNGLFLDDKRFWPIFERAQALDVPLYMHPALPHPAVAEVYYKDYLKEFPGLL